MGEAPDATLAVAIVAAASSIGTLAFSKWLESRQTDRRDEALARRESDKEVKHDLEMCEIKRDRLLEERAALLADNAFLRGKIDALTHERTPP